MASPLSAWLNPKILGVADGGEADFYLRISRAMETFAKDHALTFRQALALKQDALCL